MARSKLERLIPVVLAVLVAGCTQQASQDGQDDKMQPAPMEPSPQWEAKLPDKNWQWRLADSMDSRNGRLDGIVTADDEIQSKFAHLSIPSLQWVVSGPTVRPGIVSDASVAEMQEKTYVVANMNPRTGGTAFVNNWVDFAVFDGTSWAIEEAPVRWAEGIAFGATIHDGKFYTVVHRPGASQLWSLSGTDWAMEVVPGLDWVVPSTLGSNGTHLFILGSTSTGDVTVWEKEGSAPGFSQTVLGRNDGGFGLVPQLTFARFAISARLGEPPALAWSIDTVQVSRLENGSMQTDSLPSPRQSVEGASQSANGTFVLARSQEGEGLGLWFLREEAWMECQLPRDFHNRAALVTESDGSWLQYERVNVSVSRNLRILPLLASADNCGVESTTDPDMLPEVETIVGTKGSEPQAHR